MLNEIELVNAKIHGYGSMNFGRNLQQAYQHLAEREIRRRFAACAVAGGANSGAAHRTDRGRGRNAHLSERHDLTLFTKGHPDEQLMKVDRSRLGRYFAHTAVVKEKDAAAYAPSSRGAASDADLG